MPVKVVPHLFSDVMFAGNKTAAVVRSSLQAFSLHTCLDFVEATNQTQFIEIKNGEKCRFVSKLKSSEKVNNNRRCSFMASL